MHFSVTLVTLHHHPDTCHTHLTCVFTSITNPLFVLLVSVQWIAEPLGLSHCSRFGHILVTLMALPSVFGFFCCALHWLGDCQGVTASAYFNKFVVLVSYIFHLHHQFRLSVSFPVFIPRTQTRYECVFYFLACLSSMVARTSKHQCLLFLCSCLLAQRHSGPSPGKADIKIHTSNLSCGERLCLGQQLSHILNFLNLFNAVSVTTLEE